MSPLVEPRWHPSNDLTLIKGYHEEELHRLPKASVRLVITSPPYNLGKSYEKVNRWVPSRLRSEPLVFASYLHGFSPLLHELERVVVPGGSVCFQLGNHVTSDGQVHPLDIYFFSMLTARGFVPRNRIVWHFDHGLHAKKRLSGRYETILWMTKGEKVPYVFNLDPIRVPSKYPGKTHYKPGPKYGQLSGNPLGKNPSDFWKTIGDDWERGVWEIPNVKSNHVEKTAHPCQFPIELVERCVLALSNPGDLILDPYAGSGTTLVAAQLHGRRAIGIEKEPSYILIAKKRIALAAKGKLPRRPLGKPIHQPSGKTSRRPAEWWT